MQVHAERGAEEEPRRERGSALAGHALGAAQDMRCARGASWHVAGRGEHGRAQCASETQQQAAATRSAGGRRHGARDARAAVSRARSGPPPRRLAPLALLVLLALLATVTHAGAVDSVRDPWNELGLRRGHATPRQVRAAYLRLARELHPDKNRQDAALAAGREERFKRVLSNLVLGCEKHVRGSPSGDLFWYTL